MNLSIYPPMRRVTIIELFLLMVITPAHFMRFHIGVSPGQSRLQVDFGYWYCPDGRDETTQAQFEQVEIKPQALEWIFSVAAGFTFNISCDNLEGTCEPDRVAFQRKVHAQVMHYLEQGLPERPARLVAALQDFYHTEPLHSEQFPWPETL